MHPTINPITPLTYPTRAIVLAGGFGTRLQSVVSDVPKPMAPVAGKPFLAYLFDQLIAFNIKEVTLAVGYKHETINSYFGYSYKNKIELDYSIEDMPLGTGGAIKKALQNLPKMAADQAVFVLNGDTLFAADLYAFYRFFAPKNANLAVALCPMENFDRYGTVDISDEAHILGFREKKYCQKGLINGGIYLLKPDLLDSMPEKFSFETDFLSPCLNSDKWVGYTAPNSTYFIDIGVPDDYARAQAELVKVFVD